MLRFILILLLFFPHQSFALPLVAELGTDNIYIDHKFNGIEVLLIGARNENGRITIITRGEEKNFLVRIGYVDHYKYQFLVAAKKMHQHYAHKATTQNHRQCYLLT